MDKLFGSRGRCTGDGSLRVIVMGGMCVRGGDSYFAVDSVETAD